MPSAPFPADDTAGGEDGGRLAGSSQSRGDFGFDGIHQQASADGGTGRDRRFQSGHADHRVSHRRAGIEDDVGEVLELPPVRALAGAGFAVGAGDDRDHLHATPLELLRHLDGHDVATAGRDDERAVLRRELEIPENARGEAGDVFEEHGLTLAVRADDEVVEAQGEFDDGIEAGKRSVTRPHFLHENPAVA